jgi:uncharacterized protein
MGIILHNRIRAPSNMLKTMAIAAGLTLAASFAQAASFPCEKAASRTEKAICADKGLSALDSKLAKAYKAALQELSGNSPEETDAVRAVKADQRAWLRDRNACGDDRTCLQDAHQRRIAVISFQPDPGHPSPADRFLGRYRDGDHFFVSIMGLRDGRVAFNAAGSEPTSARWLCDFSGTGEATPDGRLIVGAPGPDGEGLILIGKKNGIEIPDTEENQAAGTYCGHGGSFVSDYERAKEK